MRSAFLLAAASAAFGLVLAAAPALAHPYGPEDEHVYPSHRCDGCSDDWGSGGSPGYWADGRYYSSYPHRYHRHRRHRYRGYRYGGYGPPAYGRPQGYGPQQPYGPPPGYAPQGQPPYPGPQGG